MKAKRHISLTNKWLAIFLSLYIFNYSIDSRDSSNQEFSEDLSYNDIESVLEFALEIVFGIENALEEHDEQDPEDGSSFEFKKVYCNSLLFGQNTTCIPLAITHNSSVRQPVFVENYGEINSPPPEV